MGNIIKKLKQLKVTHYRPTLIVAIFLSTGIIAGYRPKQEFKVLIFLIVLCIFILLFYFIKIKNARFQLFLLLCFFIGLINITFQTARIQLPKNETILQGRVIKVDHYEYSSYYVLNDCTLSNQSQTITKVKHNIRLISYDQTLTHGDVIQVNAELSYIKDATNLKGFNKRKYYLSKNIVYDAKSNKNPVTVLKNQQKLDTLCIKAKNYLIVNLAASYNPNTFGIAKGLILGEKDEMDEKVYEDFKLGGTASILAVSGLHFGIIFVFIITLLTSIGIHRKVALCIAGILMIFYAAIVGFSPSATRALIMILVYIVSKLLARKSDPLSFLCFAYILSILINPVSIFNIGFQLSFASVFTILTMTDVFMKKLNFLPRYVRSLAAVSFSASAGAAPIVINTFSYFSIIGLFANIVIIPIASICIIFVMTSAVIAAPFNLPFAYIGESLILSMNKLMTFFLKSPMTTISCKQLPTISILLWLLMLFLISYHCFLKITLKKMISITLLSIIFLIIFIPPLLDKKDLDIYFFDVNQGDAAFIKTPSGNCYMIDTGKPYYTSEILSFLQKNGYKLDAAFISHSNFDHAGGAESLVEHELLDTIYVSKPNLLDYDQNLPVTYLPLIKGDTITLDDEVTLQVLYPDFEQPKKDKNDLSLVLQLTYKDYIVLFTGDIDKSIEYKLIDTLENIDILKVAHHGSKTSSGQPFIQKTNPTYAIISVGQNSFGHPHEQTLYNLNQSCDIIFITSENGGILFEIDEQITAHPVLNEAIQY